jgi:pimeloyl-ACP methyl ester carboxylesterase
VRILAFALQTLSAPFFGGYTTLSHQPQDKASSPQLHGSYHTCNTVKLETLKIHTEKVTFLPYPQPVIFLHGGPGAGTSPNNRRFFDPDFYRIILVDQRGAGKSIPHASLVDNTTWHLVEDLEKLREILKIDKWLVGELFYVFDFMEDRFK